MDHLRRALERLVAASHLAVVAALLPACASAIPAPVIRDAGPVDHEIDVRFSYANERTFLAWNRTALALITAGLAITQLLPPFSFPGGRRVIGLPLILLGTVIAIASLRQWRLNEQAMRRHEPLPSSPLPLLIALVLGACAIVSAVLVAVAGQP